MTFDGSAGRDGSASTGAAVSVVGSVGTTAGAASTCSDPSAFVPTAPAAIPAMSTTAVLAASHPGPLPACDGAPIKRRTRWMSEPPVAARTRRLESARSSSRSARAFA